jgi:predicted transcriptional regulator
MREGEMISWIFLAIAMGSKNEPINIREISQIADGINHAVPTPKEFQLSLRFLIDNGLIEKEGKKFSLTKKGIIQYNFATMNTTITLNIWRNLERQIAK